MPKSGNQLLNDEQLLAVEHKEGPLLIIAGAGTGKTTVVTERIKHLIATDQAKPSEILALTFTEKAAREMEERVDVVMPYGYTQMWISTFHAFCDRILRDDGLNIGLSTHYNLMTQAEAIQFVRQNFFKFDLEYYRPLGNPHKFIEGVLQHFSRLKDEDVSPELYLQYVQDLKTQSASWRTKLKSEEIKEETKKYLELANAYKLYEELKAKEGVMDFSDLIANTLQLLRTRVSILKKYQRQFKFILVDEFQDTNYAQYALLKLLAPPGQNPNLTVVGDDSQSIYKFRGAAISNILQFMEDYQNAKRVVLVKNYRSTQTILDYSYQLIKHNDPDTLEVKLGINKNLQAKRKGGEAPVELFYVDRVEDEAEEVVKKIENLKLQISSLKYSDIAILVRANNHADPFMRALSRRGIPYQFLGPGALFKEPEVKDLIAYLKLLASLEDSISGYRVLSMSSLDINSRDLATISNFARKNHLSIFEACEQQEKIALTEETRLKIDKLVKTTHHHLSLASKETAGQILYYFLEEMGILAQMVEVKNQFEEKKAQNISKFFDRLKSYEAQHEDSSIFTVSDWIDLSMELGESPQATDFDWGEIDAVNLLTVHSAKGLEFPVVFLVNLVTQRFPTTERREKIPIPEALIKEILPVGDFHLEEERRLFYVGMTRARDYLFLSAASYYGEGKRVRKISPFVVETLGAEVIQKPKSIKTEDLQLSFLSWSKPEIQKMSSEVSKTSPINYLSYSQIEDFKRCPFHYKLRYLLNIPTPSSAAQAFGSSLHGALRDLYLDKIRGEEPSLEKLSHLLETNWFKEGYESKEHEKASFLKGKKLLEDFYQKEGKEPGKCLAVEQDFVFQVEKLKIGGRIDRVDQKGKRLEIIDYKTGANIPDQKEIDQDLQMTIYALAASEVNNEPFPKDPEQITFTFYYLETGERIQTLRNKEQLELAKAELLVWQQKISTSDFACNKSEMCKYCEYHMLCDVN